MSGPVDELSHQFRQAMRRLAATVTVVTTRNGDVDCGMTASAVTSLAVDPPSLLVCVNRVSALHQAITRNDLFCINILGTQHDAVSSAFGGTLPQSERFSVGTWVIDQDLPCLEDAQANIFCKRVSMFDYATHTIVIGEVTRMILNQTISPLIYCNGRYAAVAELAKSPQGS